MGPVVVTCGGCGVRIRVARPDAARDRQCPRCSTPLNTVLAEVLGTDGPVESSPRHRVVAIPTPGLIPALTVATILAAFVRVGVWLGVGPASYSPALAAMHRPDIAALRGHERGARPPELADPSPRPGGIDRETTADDNPPGRLEPADGAPSRAESDSVQDYDLDNRSAPPVLAKGSETTSPRLPLPEILSPAPSPPETAVPPPSSIAPSAERPGQIRIRNENGETVVARVHGVNGDKISVLLRDGQLGFSTGLAGTDEPYRPSTGDQMLEDLTRSGGPFATFQVLRSAHYIVLYQSTPKFAKASMRLLEDLYKNLTEALRKRDFPIHEPEFPLVAVIFRTERDFRAHKKIDSEVQAYYEILSNRIFFYQTSEHEQDSPELAALRKPQTVAHEGTHQILQNIGIHPRLSDWPLWLVEGLAEYCSPPAVRGGEAAWGGLGVVNPMHMATIRDLNDPLTVQVNGEKQARVGHDPRRPLVEYLVTRTELTPTDYALSWALTHYLVMKRSNDFLAFLKTMSQAPPLEKRTPQDHLDTFRKAFGSDLGKMDRAIAAHLSKLKYPRLPYYVVLFQQPIDGQQIRRSVLVSQSPLVIQQWLTEINSPRGGPASWQIFPHPTKARAVLTAEEWMQNH